MQVGRTTGGTIPIQILAARLGEKVANEVAIDVSLHHHH